MNRESRFGSVYPAIAVAAAIVLWGLILLELAGVFLLVFIAILVAVLLRALADPISRYTRLDPALSVILVALLSAAAVAGAARWIGPQLAEQVNELAQQLPMALEQIGEELERIGIDLPLTDGDDVPDDIGDWIFPGGWFIPWATRAVGWVITVAAQLLFIFFFAIFVSLASGRYRRGIVVLFPADVQDRADRTLGAVGTTLRYWLMGQLASMFFVGLAVGIGLWILGMPLALSLAVFAFFLEFIPIVGPWLAAAPAVLLALLEGFDMVLWVSALYVTVQLLESNVLLPLIMERAVYLPPALTLGALFLMGTLFGFFGMVVATPLVAVGLVLVKRLYLGEEDELTARKRRRRKRQEEASEEGRESAGEEGGDA